MTKGLYSVTKLWESGVLFFDLTMANPKLRLVISRRVRSFFMSSLDCAIRVVSSDILIYFQDTENLVFCVNDESLLLTTLVLNCPVRVSSTLTTAVSS